MQQAETVEAQVLVDRVRALEAENERLRERVGGDAAPDVEEFVQMCNVTDEQEAFVRVVTVRESEDDALDVVDDEEEAQGTPRPCETEDVLICDVLAVGRRGR